ncbi:MAG: hypothetical protein AB8U25_00395 [Rickettsiales endosymbiont of Dermacentor nuttalli]
MLHYLITHESNLDIQNLDRHTPYI